MKMPNKGSLPNRVDRYRPDRFILICKDDNGQYRLATRRTFDENEQEELDNKVDGIAPSRVPIIVACDPDTVILRKESL
jgi:hypothetical protein